MSIPEHPTVGVPWIEHKPPLTPRERERQRALWPKDNFSRKNVAKFSGTSDNRCGNCGLSSHHFDMCFGPISQNGRLSGCSIHGTRDHSYDECWHEKARIPESLELFLIKKRIGLPMLDSQLYSLLPPVLETTPVTQRPLLPHEVLSNLDRWKNWSTHIYIDTKVARLLRNTPREPGLASRISTATPKSLHHQFGPNHSQRDHAPASRSAYIPQNRNYNRPSHFKHSHQNHSSIPQPRASEIDARQKNLEFERDLDQMIKEAKSQADKKNREHVELGKGRKGKK